MVSCRNERGMSFAPLFRKPTLKRKHEFRQLMHCVARRHSRGFRVKVTWSHVTDVGELGAKVSSIFRGRSIAQKPRSTDSEVSQARDFVVERRVKR